VIAVAKANANAKTYAATMNDETLFMLCFKTLFHKAMASFFAYSGAHPV